MGDDESRADRMLRKRQQRDKRDKTGESDESAGTDNASGTSKTDKPSIKEEREGKMLYLTPSLGSELSQMHKRLSLAYEDEYGAELEKNRHTYPLVIKYGLEGLDGLDGEDIRERLEKLDVWVPR
jgi:hypothetical protein